MSVRHLNFVVPPYSDTIHLFPAGQPISTTTCAEFLAPCEDLLIGPHGIRPKRLEWMLHTLDAILTTTLPWCSAALAPQLAKDGNELCGFAVWPPGNKPWILISADQGAEEFTRTVHHECWHIAECMLAPETVQAVTDSLDANFEGYGEPEIYGDPSERRAVAYAAWAVLAESGLMITNPHHPAMATFEHVYRGNLANSFTPS